MNLPTDFFAWWRRKLVVIEDFLYVGVDFSSSADLMLPEGTQWDVSGTKDHNLVTIFFLFLYVFGCTTRDLSHFVFIMQIEVHHVQQRCHH
jgi:hypothetical protein